MKISQHTSIPQYNTFSCIILTKNTGPGDLVLCPINCDQKNLKKINDIIVELFYDTL